ncbi:Gfo/Idh/MocA family oxidoreductase [Parvibaculum sp.]|uniref:Gfo/Idh/MocA family protein n=1 Tax=Parvibaculum sp. TaxID=2024848 RepID=UPI0025DF9BFF|nr:Gfo/Idh/MocA family oxidoreductase [Parvibaculum sp.]
MSDTIRYGIIGSGMMGIEHIMNINIIPGARVTAIADPHQGSRDWGRATAEGEIAVHDDYRDMLASGAVDAVIVATPNYTHAAVLDDIFETSLHVLCEKPLCTTIEDARKAAARAKTHKGVFWVGMEYRYMPPVTRFVEEVHGGRTGRLKMFAIREHRFPFLKKIGDWNRFSRNTGGTLVEKSCHYFDMMRHVVQSEPVRIYASGGQDVNHLDERYDGAVPDILDNAFVIVDFANGVRAMHDLCMFAEGSRNQEEMSAVGDSGKIECLIPESNLVFGTRQPKKVEVEHVAVRDDVLKAGYHHGASYYQHLAFQRAIRENGPAQVTADDGLRAVAMGLAAHRSIDEGRPVSMSEFGL